LHVPLDFLNQLLGGYGFGRIATIEQLFEGRNRRRTDGNNRDPGTFPDPIVGIGDSL
jgi:hypothetical protein